jgi:predicted PurR-regulated permease PerM
VPRILGKAMGLSPAVMLLSLSVWGKLLGMLGLLIALPMTCLVLAYYRRLVLVPPATGLIAESGGEGKT